MNKQKDLNQKARWIKNVVASVLLIIGIAVVNWRIQIDSKVLVDLEKRAKQNEQSRGEYEKLRTQVLGGQEIDRPDPKKDPVLLQFASSPFDGVMQRQLPERLWKDDLPLFFLQNTEDAISQIYLGEIEVDLELVIRKVDQSIEDPNPLVDMRVTTSPNSWQFLELNLTKAAGSTILKHRISNRESDMEFQELKLGQGNYYFGAANSTGIRHFEELLGDSSPVVFDKSIVPISDDNQVQYRVQLKLVPLTNEN